MSELGIDYMSAVAISGAALGGIFSSMQGYLKAGSAKKFSPRMFMWCANHVFDCGICGS